MAEPSILVTGITGMIGHAVLRRLVAAGRSAWSLAQRYFSGAVGR